MKTVFRVHTASSTHYFFLADSEASLRTQLQSHGFWKGHGDASITVTAIHGDRQGILGEVMNSMGEGWRYRWCDSSMCGCMGCSNRSGSLSQLGFTHEEWREWVSNNPDPRPVEDLDAKWEALRVALSTKH